MSCSKPSEDNLEPTDNASVQGRVSLRPTWTAPNLQLLWVFTPDKDPHFVRPYRPHREVKGRVKARAWKAQGSFSISEQVTWGVKDGKCSILPEGEGVQERAQADKIENKMKHFVLCWKEWVALKRWIKSKSSKKMFCLLPQQFPHLQTRTVIYG